MIKIFMEKLFYDELEWFFFFVVYDMIKNF